jgi:hypothetical protein
MTGTSRAALRLERLDERTLPSVSVAQSGGTLTITGDQRANTVQVQDDGTAGGLTVTVDGTGYPISGPVTAVVINTRGGNDRVSYDLTGDYVGTTRTVTVSLGNGDDTFTADLGHRIDAASGLTLTVDGGNGKDNLSVTGSGGGPVAGTLSVQLRGGNGTDTIGFNYAAEVDASVSITADGGNGKDTITGTVAVGANSTGSVVAHELGGNGSDTLGLSVTGDGLAGLAGLDAAVDTGHGKDAVTVTDNVTITTPAHGR